MTKLDTCPENCAICLWDSVEEDDPILPRPDEFPFEDDYPDDQE